MSYQVPYNTTSGHHDAHTYQNSQDLYNPYHPQHHTDEQPRDVIYNNYPPAQRASTSFSRKDHPVRRMTSEFDEGEFPGPGEMPVAPSGSK
jgi:hypothetical protein